LSCPLRGKRSARFDSKDSVENARLPCNEGERAEDFPQGAKNSPACTCVLGHLLPSAVHFVDFALLAEAHRLGHSLHALGFERCVLRHLDGHLVMLGHFVEERLVDGFSSRGPHTLDGLLSLTPACAMFLTVSLMLRLAGGPSRGFWTA
jgi:hypothetical protein